MKHNLLILKLALVFSFAVSCTSAPIKPVNNKIIIYNPKVLPIITQENSFRNNINITEEVEIENPTFSSYADFVNHYTYPKTYKVYQEDELIELAKNKNPRIEINTATQRLLLLVDDKVALDTPATTGSEAKRDINDGIVSNKATPLGSYKIIQKLEHKRSNIYGDFYFNGKKIYTGDIRKFKEPYDEFVGVDMPYWMRFKDAMGIHFSEAVARIPGSNGCVRLPMEPIELVFSLVKKGTIVDVVSKF